MASTNPGVLEEIEGLFSWNPPLLLSPTKPSTASCPPGFYDKHFSPEYVLKRVERFPYLIRDLAQNVDKALRAAEPTLPPLGPGFTPAEMRDFQIGQIERVAKNEEAVATLYDKYTSYFLSVASTLALHPKASFSKWTSLLFWTQSVSSSGYAIMDGELRFTSELGVNDAVKSHWADILNTMDDTVRIIFAEMRKSGLGVATWKIKGLGAGLSDAMSGVLSLGTFSWTTCTATNCAKIPNRRQVKRVKELVIGPDARVPPWSLPSTVETRPSTPTINKRERGDASPLNDNVKKFKRDDEYDAKDESEDIGEEYRDEKEEQEAFQDRHDLTAHNLVQQAWAQATRVDGTVIVLHSGNHELVCIRHRASQTLYVSEVIEPHACVEPGYGKLQVGIYVAAIQDAIDRKQQQRSPVSQPNPSSDGGTLISGNIDHGNTRRSGSGCRDKPKGGRGVEKSGGFQGFAGGIRPTGDVLAIENMIYEISKINAAHVYLRYDVYDSPIPASFIRSVPSIMEDPSGPTPPLSPQTIRTYRPHECMSIILTSEIGRGATGVVHRGTLMLQMSDTAMQLDVVVKLAFDIEPRKVLKREYEVYHRLRSKGVERGIATTLGFFDDREDSASALVMLYAGVPLSADSQGSFSISDYESVLSILESIHNAGIRHGDIRPENVLRNDLRVTIIDFGHAKYCDDQQAKGVELALLRDVFGLAGESQLPQISMISL